MDVFKLMNSFSIGLTWTKCLMTGKHFETNSLNLRDEK